MIKRILKLFIFVLLLNMVYITQQNYKKVSDANDELIILNGRHERTINQLKKQLEEYEQEDKTPIVILNKTIDTDDFIFSEEEVELLCSCVQAEAGKDNDIAQKMCTQVILNRVRDDEFPDNIEDVIMQKISGVQQFSVVYDGRLDSQVVTDRTRRNVMEILLYGGSLPRDVLYFYASNLESDNWVKKLEIYQEVEGTVFCKR